MTLVAPRKFRPVVLSVTAALLLCACAVGPDYDAPDMRAPAQFVSQDVLRALNEGKEGAALPMEWWRGFADPVLNILVKTGLEKNYEIAAAAARVREAQARVQLAGAADNLQVDGAVDGSVQEERNLTSGTATTSTSVFGVLGAALPLDVFGGTARSVEAAQANLENARAAMNGIILRVSADIAAEYLRLRGNQRQLELLRESVGLQEETLSIVQTRFDAGLAPELDVRRAETSVENLRANIPPLEEALLNSRNALATLTGDYPGVYEDLLGAQGDIPAYQDAIPAALPLDVLNSRPDVRQAEAVLRQQVAEIGVAAADYYPSFEISSQIRIGTRGVSGAPGVDVLIATLAGMIGQVIFDGGARDANMDIAKAQADAALADYERTLREAAQEVETVLAAIDSSRARQESLQKSVNSSSRSFRQAEILYQQGLISFLDVVDAQRVLASAEQALASERTNYATQIARLFQVLGVDVPHNSSD